MSDARRTRSQARRKTGTKKKAGGKKKAGAKTKAGAQTKAGAACSRTSSVGPSSAEFGRRRARPKGLRLTGLLPAPLRRLGARIPPLKPRRLKGLGLGLLLGVALLACVTEQAPTLPPAVTPPEPEIRVRLFEHPLAKTATTTVGLQGAWQLQGESGASYGVVALRQPTLEVSLERGGLHVKGFDPLGTWLELLPQDDDATFTLNERTYLGALRLEPTASGKGLQATNTLGIEAYLLGVVGYESPLGWLDEALYSQAIAARTYALVGLKPTRDYDVVDDTRDQVYRGLMDTPEHRARLRKLVDGTRGVVVTYEGKPITTYFHSTCGGDTVPAEWIFPWVHEPFEPWSGASDCPCQASKYYRWEQPRELGKGQDPDAQSPAQALVLKLPLTAATIEHYPRGGYVKNLLLTDQTGEVTRVPGWEARRVFGLRGYAFDVQLGAGGMSLEFTGRGWGHGVGMCQFGAQGRAKQGWTHGQILANYYPGTQLVTLPYAAE